MRLLLDSHVFLWYITDDARLKPAHADAIRQPDNEAYLSVVSVWEILIKHQSGKLPLPAPADEYLQVQREQHGIASLPLEENSVSRLLKLPMHHRDPFDRMLICQAIYHDLVLATVDDQFADYPIALLP